MAEIFVFGSNLLGIHKRGAALTALEKHGAIMGQGKVKEYQNLVFKILGFSKKQIVFSSLIEFIIIFKSVILIAILFAVIGSKFIMENIFELVWMFDFTVLIYLGFSIGFVTLILILLTNLKYLNPKVYPLIRNQ